MGHPIIEQPGLRIREVRTIECKPVGLTVPGGEERVAKAHSRFMDLTAEVANKATQFFDQHDVFLAQYGDEDFQDDALEVRDAIDARNTAQEEFLRAMAGVPEVL